MDTLLIFGIILGTLTMAAIAAAFGLIVVVLFSIRQALDGLTRTMADAEKVMKAFSIGASDVIKELIEETAKAKAHLQQIELDGAGVPRNVRDLFQRPRGPQAEEDEQSPDLDMASVGDWAQQ